ncbi:polyketide synthase docking domain-containing protein [Streptomyces sp. CB02959]|uniref:polyketide synthase docking domain-containing protein n=1 Tax=Streptomyces sp. CB02959 TaxID=2020330 RepID=UPI0011AF3E10
MGEQEKLLDYLKRATADLRAARKRVAELESTKSGFRITLIGYWLIGLPAAWLLAYAANLDTLGIWLDLLTGLAATAILLLRRYDTALHTQFATTQPVQAA